MLLWRIYYDDGSTFDSGQGAWSEARAGGVLWVDVWNGTYHHRLMGRDYYWLDMPNGTFGLFNDPDNLDWYGGNPDEQASAWRWLDAGSELIDPEPPVGVHVLHGVMLPDDEWEVARNGH